MLVANSRGFANPLRRLYPPYSKSSAKSVPDASSEVPRYDVILEGRNRATERWHKKWSNSAWLSDFGWSGISVPIKLSVYGTGLG